MPCSACARISAQNAPETANVAAAAVIAANDAANTHRSPNMSVSAPAKKREKSGSTAWALMMTPNALMS
jgi:hypothetical protein